MKGILRNTVFNAFSLFAAVSLLPGIKVAGGLGVYLFAGFLLTLMSYTIRPVLSLISLPLNLATFGVFSIVTNALILYILTIFVPEITIGAFIFQGFSFAGFVIPKISLNHILSFLAVSAVISLMDSAVRWLTR